MNCELCNKELRKNTSRTMCPICQFKYDRMTRENQPSQTSIQAYFSEFLDRVMAVEKRLTDLEDHFHAEENWANNLEKRIDRILKKI